MRNGEWFVYKNYCSKKDPKAPSPFSVFIGKDSDGKWYFSSWHFCIDVINLRMEGQPVSLQAFKMAYYLNSFDGTVKNCPQKTCPIENEFENRGGSSDAEGNLNLELIRANGKNGIWKRVRILAYGKIYELTDKQLARLKGFSPNNESGCGITQWYSFIRTVTVDGITKKQEVKIIINPDSGLTINGP